jgi:hypothetical protein
MKSLIATGAASLLVAFPALAQYTYPSIEDAARITEAHATKLDRDSAQRFGEMIRFDVKVGWKNPEVRPETEAPYRIVRYLAKCEDKQLAVSAVAVIDGASRIVKNFGIAPGGWDFLTPEKASAESQFLERVCDMPL